MNWIKHTAIFAVIVRSALILCAVLFLAAEHTNADDPSPFQLDEEGQLIIGDGETPTVVTLDNDALEDLEGMWGIIIEKEGTLVIEPGTMVYLGTDGQVAVQGTLQIKSTLGTGIYSGNDPWDGISDFPPTRFTRFNIDGGTIEIGKGDDDALFADSINVTLGANGGTIDIAAGVTFESGTISGQSGGVTKTGGGTYRVGNVSMGGIFDVQAGNVVFLDGATVGVLKSDVGTVISGESLSPDTKSDLSILEKGSVIAGTLHDIGSLTIIKGGKISGTLTDIDSLIVGDGQFEEVLTFESGFHTIGTIGIAGGATLNVGEGTGIQLGPENHKDSYDDIIIFGGTLAQSSASLGIGKAVGKGDTYVTVYNGTINIYKDASETTLDESGLHIRAVGTGEVIVAPGVTFQSGTINSHPEVDGADLVVSGGGIYKAAAVDIGTGYFMVEGTTTMDFLQTVTAGALTSEKDTLVHTRGDALFDQVSLAGSYVGHGQNLTILQGGFITGHVSDVNVLTLGGTLLLSVDDTAIPTISADKWAILDPENTYVRTVAGTTTGSYQNVIQVMGSDTDKDNLRTLLNASHSALYRPEWSLNETDDTFLDLFLSILSVSDYIRDEWHREGSNITNIGNIFDDISSLYSPFREHLESLSDEQLQGVLRNALAGELAGNAFRMAMYQPAHSVFRHLDTVSPLRSPFRSRGAITRGQEREGYHVWFNPYGQAERAKGEADTFDGYNMVRYGFNLGGDVEIYNRAVFGAFFGYAAPNVKSDLGKISANDYRGGLYLRMPTAWEVVVNMMIGFGKQDYSYRNSFMGSDFHGSSLFGSIELSRPIPLLHYSGHSMVMPYPNPPLATLIPLVALDFQSAVMDDFMAYDESLGGVLIQPEDLSSAVLRIGLLGELWRIRTRLQYMRQIAGNDVVFSQTTVGGLAAAQIRGTQWGKDWLNVGIGGELLQTRHWRVFADYNFEVGKSTTSHLGSLNTVLTW